MPLLVWALLVARNGDEYCHGDHVSVHIVIDKRAVHLTNICHAHRVSGDHGRKRLSIVDENCDVVGIIRDAGENAKFLCEQYYCTSPPLEITKPDDDKRYPYIPSHLYHMCFELLKNSMRAVIEKHGEDDLPPVKVVVIVGNEDLTIKVCLSRGLSSEIFINNGGKYVACVSISEFVCKSNSICMDIYVYTCYECKYEHIVQIKMRG